MSAAAGGAGAGHRHLPHMDLVEYMLVGPVEGLTEEVTKQMGVRFKDAHSKKVIFRVDGHKISLRQEDLGHTTYTFKGKVYTLDKISYLLGKVKDDGSQNVLGLVFSGKRLGETYPDLHFLKTAVEFSGSNSNSSSSSSGRRSRRRSSSSHKSLAGGARRRRQTRRHRK